MSHWAELKCEVKCSIDVMRRALLKINAEWERNMEMSEAGTLNIDNQYMGGRGGDESNRSGFHLKVKGARAGGARDLPYADLGLKRTADGTWSIIVDRAGQNYIRDIDNHVAAVVAQMKAVALANQNEGCVVSQEYNRERGTSVTFIEMDIDDGEPNIEGFSY